MDTALKDDELAKVMGILHANKGKNFVRRILTPDQYPRLDLGDGNYATHMMANAEVDGKHVVYPTVTYDAKTKKLRQLDGDAALNTALNSGDFVEFDNAEEADWFSRRYKAAWGE